MALFNEMADIAMKELGKVGLIYLSISILFCVYLIVLFWKRWKSMAREFRLTQNEDFKTVARTTANVGSGLVALDGLSGSNQSDIGPADIGLEPDACDSVFDVLLEFVFSIFR
jgi:hypothetical protein